VAEVYHKKNIAVNLSETRQKAKSTFRIPNILKNIFLSFILLLSY